ncbi:hypothetical protein [Chitinolyticbacter albus]|uniref:hypothetical protein n=1 Tax=Chitinolyticbacter albus TaxID=2961951 RepID=UPI0021093F69|nr:hypothetical protein [Chitinolyticbacter albus]
MNPAIVLLAAMLAYLFTTASTWHNTVLLAPWTSRDVGTAHYAAQIDHRNARTGPGAKTLYYHGGAISQTRGLSSHGVIEQVISARKFAGQRIRFSAQLRSRGADGAAGLWLRVDQQGGRCPVFDDMRGRPIVSDGDWQPRHIVLDIPSDAERISFGAYLAGKGQLWMDEVKFEIVNKNVSPTRIISHATGAAARSYAHSAKGWLPCVDGQGKH